MSADGSSECAACGRASDNLKTCADCTAVKYCNAKCKKAHHKEHKDECQSLFDEALFKQPQPREDCPICFLPLPHSGETFYLECCGKSICGGCGYADDYLVCCPFCRASLRVSDEERVARCRKRMAAGDTDAFVHLGRKFMWGQWGLKQDHHEALKLFQRAVELGSTDAHYSIGCLYYDEEFITRDRGKAICHWQKAAMGGHELARYILGLHELSVLRNSDQAVRHYVVVAKCGYKKGLDSIQECFLKGDATKAQFEEALRGYHASEVHSAQRKKAAEMKFSRNARS